MLIHTLHDLASRHGARKPAATLILKFNRRILAEMMTWAEQQRLAEYFGLKAPVKRPARRK